MEVYVFSVQNIIYNLLQGMFHCCFFCFTLKLITRPVYRLLPPWKKTIHVDSGIHTFVWASTAAPWLTRTSATLTLSSWAAKCNGVSPLCKWGGAGNNLERWHINIKYKFNISKIQKVLLKLEMWIILLSLRSCVLQFLIYSIARNYNLKTMKIIFLSHKEHFLVWH